MEIPRTNRRQTQTDVPPTTDGIRPSLLNDSGTPSQQQTESNEVPYSPTSSSDCNSSMDEPPVDVRLPRTNVRPPSTTEASPLQQQTTSNVDPGPSTSLRLHTPSIDRLPINSRLPRTDFGRQYIPHVPSNTDSAQSQSQSTPRAVSRSPTPRRTCTPRTNELPVNRRLPRINRHRTPIHPLTSNNDVTLSQRQVTSNAPTHFPALQEPGPSSDTSAQTTRPTSSGEGQSRLQNPSRFFPFRPLPSSSAGPSHCASPTRAYTGSGAGQSNAPNPSWLSNSDDACGSRAPTTNGENSMGFATRLYSRASPNSVFCDPPLQLRYSRSLASHRTPSLRNQIRQQEQAQSACVYCGSTAGVSYPRNCRVRFSAGSPITPEEPQSSSRRRNVLVSLPATVRECRAFPERDTSPRNRPVQFSNRTPATRKETPRNNAVRLFDGSPITPEGQQGSVNPGYSSESSTASERQRRGSFHTETREACPMMRVLSMIYSPRRLSFEFVATVAMLVFALLMASVPMVFLQNPEMQKCTVL